jgi:hypothetical protein
MLYSLIMNNSRTENSQIDNINPLYYESRTEAQREKDHQEQSEDIQCCCGCYCLYYIITEIFSAL